jgi:outer membrane receptor for ferrienterochelin and colicin
MSFKNKAIPYKRSLLCAAVSLSLLPLAGQSIAQDESIEEVVVTGSFIRRSEGFQSASQATQLTAADLEAQGTLNLGEVIQNLTFVNGAASAITNTIQGTSDRSSNIDLRGLGPRSTLTLLDGKRLANQNVNTQIPTIAIQRLDIVADGAAALYGNEAVAGVVNFVPYKSFDGLRVETYAEGDDRGDYDEHSVQMMWGGDIGDLDVVVAGQFRSNSRLGWDERPVLANSGLTISSNSPGNWAQPVRGADGQYTGAFKNVIDPACGSRSERDEFLTNQVASPYGLALGSSCFFEFGDTRSYREPTDNNKLYTNMTWEVDDALTLSAQAYRARQHQTSYTSTSNPGNSRIGELGSIRGELPGNPFRAVDAAGNQLYGVDANGDGVPDRGTSDLNNDGLMDYLISGIANNGIPLSEDVRPRTMRPINKTNTVPSGHSYDYDNLADYLDTVSRVSFQADFEVPFLEGWEGMASWTQSESTFQIMSNQNYDIEAMKKGLACDVVNDRDACYNPFFVTDPSNLTSIHVMNDIAARDTEYEYDQLTTIDVILNGEVPLGGFELPGGPIGAAVGYQLRQDAFTNTPSAVELMGNTWIGGTEPEVITSGNRDVDSYFAEFAIPVLDNLEIEAAVRREEFSTGQSSTDPKFGLTFAPTDWLTLRGTQGTAFIAPTLNQLYDPVSCGLSTVTDRFGPFSAFTTACAGGNANLKNETADTQSLGFDLVFENWDVHVTWNNTAFENRIVTTTGQQIAEIDFQNYKEWSGFTGNGIGAANQPAAGQLQAWLASGLSDPRIIRSPANIFEILQVSTGDSNASIVDVTSYDFQANYRIGFDRIGDFRFNLQATYVDSFLYQEDPTKPIVEAAGKYNDTTGVAPEMPQLKANLQINWSKGDHSVNAIVRYVDDMPYDGPLFTHLDYFANYNRPGNIAETGVLAWTDMDIGYTYRGLEFMGSDVNFTVGSRNVFDREAQRSPEFAGVLGGLQDPMGRNIYARIQFDL